MSGAPIPTPVSVALTVYVPERVPQGSELCWSADLDKYQRGRGMLSKASRGAQQRPHLVHWDHQVLWATEDTHQVH